MMKIVGIDASINSTGCVSFDVDSQYNIVGTDYLSFTQVKKHETNKIIHFKKQEFSDYIQQNLWMIARIRKFCLGAEYVAIEDYAYAATGKVFHIAEFIGGMKDVLYLENSKIRFYDPPSIKLFATGKGNADKVRMVDEFDLLTCNEKPNLDFLLNPARNMSKYDSPRSDLVDAFFIAKFLHLELMLKNKIVTTSNLPKDHQKIFSRVTKAYPTPLIERSFICRV